jgi:two-component system, NarL family, response regulator
MTSSLQPLRVLLADDHEVVREGLASILHRLDDAFRVVAHASDGEEAVSHWRSHKPDIGIVDLRMPKLDGVGVIKAIRAEFPEARLIILTTYDTDEDIYQGLRAGAKGYLLKDADWRDIVDALRTVSQGRSYIPSLVAAKLAGRLQGETLSPKETEVLAHIAQGRSNKEIARLMTVTEGTVKLHANKLFMKLNVSSRSEAIRVGLDRGLVKLG